MGFYIGIGGVVTFKNAKYIKGSCSLYTVRQNRIRDRLPHICHQNPIEAREILPKFKLCSRSAQSDQGINKEELIAVTEENARQLYRMKEV